MKTASTGWWCVGCLLTLMACLSADDQVVGPLPEPTAAKPADAAPAADATLPLPEAAGPEMDPAVVPPPAVPEDVLATLAQIVERQLANPVPELIARFDADHDGHLSEAEKQVARTFAMQTLRRMLEEDRALAQPRAAGPGCPACRPDLPPPAEELPGQPAAPPDLAPLPPLPVPVEPAAEQPGTPAPAAPAVPAVAPAPAAPEPPPAR